MNCGIQDMTVHKHLPGVFASVAVSAVLLCQPAMGTESGLKELKADTADAAADDPVIVTVSIDQQHLRVFRGLQQVADSNISSGKPGHDTPRGIFSILEKKKKHHSNIYDSAPMPFMQRLTWSGIALHESGSVPARPASHGCVRLPRGFSQELYGLTSRGNHVIITPEGAEPRQIAHANLFQPASERLALNEFRSTISDIEQEPGSGVIAGDGKERSKSPLRIYLTRQTQRDSIRDVQEMLQILRFYGGALDGLYGRGSIAAVKRFQEFEGLAKTGTLTGETIERLHAKTGRPLPPAGRIYVRQDHEPVFDAPVEIRNPEQPLGSHLFVTYRYDDNQTKWLAYSVSSEIRPSIVKQDEIELGGNDRVRTSPEAVLDRLVIPSDVMGRIEAMLTSGSSFAISDNGIGTETGKGTDFIVQTH
jgi:hypothetical protein